MNINKELRLIRFPARRFATPHHSLAYVKMTTYGDFFRSKRMVDLQISNTNFGEYFFIDPRDTNVTYAIVSSYSTGHHLVKIRTDEEEGVPSDLIQKDDTQ